MKSNYVHVVFVIDESGSMCGKEDDVIGGFKKVVDEQKKNKEGGCAVSFYKFATTVKKVFTGIDVKEVEYLDGKYSPDGMTALFDGIGTAIYEVTKWEDDLKEEERPEKTVVVIMTDGGENNSKDYRLSKIKDMISHKEKSHNWSFIYMGSDLSDAKDVDNLGINTRCFSSKNDYISNYAMVNSSISAYRNCDGDAITKNSAFVSNITLNCNEATAKYASDNNLDLDSLKSQN